MATGPAVESFPFPVETTQLLNLTIHSLYPQKEIFLRELIANASDALKRLRWEALTDPGLVSPGHNYEIRLKPDRTARTLTIADTGIGMSRQELIEQIGTIARPGTRELRRRMPETQSAEAYAELIGHFGVGFYSAFMVADKVTILTRRAGQNQATGWESTGDGTYTLREAEKAGCGTEITLHLKEPEAGNGIEDYTDRSRLAMMVHKYSDFISYPISYEGPPGEPRGEEAKTREARIEAQPLNAMKPIWTRTRSDVNKSGYHEFYKRLSHDLAEPLKVLPFQPEGNFEYQALLFIPSKAPGDLFYHTAEWGLRLRARRVMVLRCEDLLPRYLRFIRGVVEATDLSLNISRQRLQPDRHITQIRKGLTRRVLDALGEMKEKESEKYLEFWAEFGRVMKEGLTSDYENRGRLVPLVLLPSSNDPKELTTFKAYLERMKPDQTEILYLTGKSRTAMENSPHLEGPRQKGYEVLYLSDPVDELMVQSLDQVEGKKLKSVTQGRVSWGKEEEKKQREEKLKREQEEYRKFLDACHRKLDPYVKRIELSARLVDSPACLITEERPESSYLQHRLERGKDGAGKPRPIMALNAHHPLIRRLKERFKSDPADPLVGDSMEVLFELAQLSERPEVPDPVHLNQLTLEFLERTI